MKRAERLYRRLLRLYPAEFRRAFASEMERDFTEEYGSADGGGARGRLLLHAFLDVLTTAPTELWRELRLDLRHATRLYLKHPINTAIAITVLAIGMAFVGALLSLYVDLALKPIPGLEDSGQLVTIAQINDIQSGSLPFRFTERISEEVTAIEAAVAVGTAYQEILYAGDRVRLEYASQGFFEIIRPELALGRGFLESEYAFDAEPVIVLSDRYWRDQFGARDDVIGESIELDPPQQGSDFGEAARFRVIGVMAPEMRGILSEETDLWVPLEQYLRLINGEEADYQSIQSEAYGYALARLSDGASAKLLRHEIASRYPDASVEFDLYGGFHIDVVEGVVPDVRAHRAARSQLRLFLAGGLLLALVATANVSLFLLARAPGRRRELAIRLALGAPVSRLARQLATEAGLLVVVSAIFGLLASVWLAGFLQGTDILRGANWGSVTLVDWRVLGLVGCFLLVLTLLVSLAPILGLKKVGIASAARQVAARATPAQRIAGTVQVAIAGGLGGLAIAFIWYLGSMLLLYPGYETGNRYVALLWSDAPVRNFGAPALIEATRRREVIEALPGIEALTFSFMVPGQNLFGKRRVRDPVDPSREISVFYGAIDYRFVAVLGLQMVQGQAPTEGDFGTSVINEAAARLLFGRTDIVGEQLELDPVVGQESDAARTTQIVGVLKDIPFRHPAADADPMLLTNLAPPSGGLISAIIESPLGGADLQQALQGQMDSGALDFTIVASLVPLRDFRDRRIAPDKTRGLLTIGTAGLVVFLAAIGFYGTQRYLVAAGRREYAIRAAIGASPGALRRLVLGRGLKLGLPGLVSGATLAFLLVAWLRDDLVARDISPGAVALIVAAGLATLLLIASTGPAMRAHSTAPAALLREDSA